MSVRQVPDPASTVASHRSFERLLFYVEEAHWYYEARSSLSPWQASLPGDALGCLTRVHMQRSDTVGASAAWHNAVLTASAALCCRRTSDVSVLLIGPQLRRCHRSLRRVLPKCHRTGLSFRDLPQLTIPNGLPQSLAQCSSLPSNVAVAIVLDHCSHCISP